MEKNTTADSTQQAHNRQNKIDQFIAENRYYLWSFLVLWSIACYLLFGVIEKGEVILFFAERRTESLNAFFLFSTYLGEGYVYVGATLLFLLVHYSKSIAICINALLVLLISQALKYAFGHERPKRYFDDLLGKPELPNYVPDVELLSSWTTSFPSGHTTSAFAFYTLIAFFVPQKWLKILCLFLATLVGLSRIYLVQHFLKDVTAGMLTGFLIALFVYWCYTKLTTTVQ